MFERLTSTLLQRLLQKYFVLDEDYDDDDDHDNNNDHDKNRHRRTRRRRRQRSNSSSNFQQHQMSIWSGFVRWNHLELRVDWINQELRRRGQPFQVVHGHVSLLTVSIPWTKLASSNSSPQKKKNKNDSNNKSAVIVVVLDGVHLLVRTDYSFDDDALRQHDQEQRRKALQSMNEKQQQPDGSSPSASSSSTSFSSSLRDLFKNNKFIQGSLLPHLADHLQIHVRDLHIRLEDAGDESDPSSQPFACGIVLESMHIQNATADPSDDDPPPPTQQQRDVDDANDNNSNSHDGDNDDTSKNSSSARVIHKVSQLNHLGIYWTPLETTSSSSTSSKISIPVERTLLQNLHKHAIVAALDASIARRIVTSELTVGGGNHGRSNSMSASMPQHLYFLTPVDATAQADLLATTTGTSSNTSSSSTNQTKNTPPIVALQIQVASQVTLSIRDDQCLALLRLRHAMQEHKYRKVYHCKFRPQVSVHEDARAWWRYGLAVIQYELYETRLRWSWHRFRQAYAHRQRYCDLYKRKLLALLEQQHDDDDQTNDDPQDESSSATTNQQRALSSAEEEELQAMEDGLIGDLSVRDILLYRIIVQKRIYSAVPVGAGGGSGGGGGDNSSNSNGGSRPQHSSWLRRTVSNMVRDDTEAQEEYHRLLSYWQEWSEAEGLGTTQDASSSSNSIIAVSIDLRVNQGRLVLYSPLPATADQKACRRLQERFLDFCYTGLSVNFSLLGDLASVRVQLVLADFVGTETRASNHQSYTVIQRTSKKQQHNSSNNNNSGSSTCNHGEATSGGAMQENAEYVSMEEEQQRQQSPLLVFTLVKNPPSTNDFHTGINLELQALQVTLVPECEWILRLKALLQPIPHMKKLESFWDDLSMAYINSLAKRGLGLVAKAETAVSEHRNIDVDIMVDCPVFCISDEKGNQLVYDLGRLYIKTEKLAGVANAKLIRSIKDQHFNAALHRDDSSGAGVAVNDKDSGWGNGMGLWDDQSVVSQLELRNTWSAASSANKIGVAAPTTPWTTPHRSNNNSFLGRSFRDLASCAEKSGSFEDESRDDQLGGAASGGDAMDDFFYDTYGVQLATGSLKLVFSNGNTDGGNGNNLIVEEICGGVDIVLMLHKSIIPHDSTLYRFRTGCSIEDVEISISETAVIQLMYFFNEWSRILCSNNPIYIRQGSFLSESSRILIVEQEPMSVEDSESTSVFNEDEFFDCNSEASVVADNPMVEDNWIADSESVLESETRSVGRSVRSRKRRKALSDVSSISENSAGMRRRFHAANYLSADNLARLEEKVDEESVAEGLNDDDSEAESFRSAISPGRLGELANDLLLDIQNTEEMLKGLRTQLSDFRKNADANKSADPAISTVKRLLRLEIDRTTAELLAMRATFADLTAQIQSAEEEHSKPVGSQASQFAKRASTLLQTRKKRGPAGVEHSLIRNLKRALVQSSISCGSVVVRFRPVDSERVIDSPSLSICIVQSNAVLRQSIDETKLFLSVENLTTSFYMKDTPRVFAVGGSVDPYAVNLLPSRFPQYISAATMEDKLLRTALTFQQGRSRDDPSVPFKLVKLRVAFGDVELRPCHAQLQEMTDSLLRIADQRSRAGRRNELALANRVGSQATTPGIYVDVCAQFSSLRLLLTDKIAVAVVLTELKTKIIGSFYKDRSQIDVRCGNIQLLHLDDREAEATEVFGKRDSYNPLVRARWRTQKSPAGETGGWVVAWGPTARTAHREGHREGSDPSLELKMTLNSHVVVKVDALACQMSPRILSGLRLCFDTWKDFSAKSMSSYRRRQAYSSTQPDNGTLAPSSLALRWRLDLSVRKSSVVVQTNLNEAETGLILSLGLLAFIQQLGEGREGIAAECVFQEIRLGRSGNEHWPVLETTIIVGVGLIVKSPLCALVDVPHLQIPKEALLAFSHEQGRNSAYPEIDSVEPTADMPVALTLSVLPFRINITAAICSNAKRICQELLQSLTPRRDGKVNKVSTSEASGTARLRLKVLVESVSLTLLREGRNLVAYPEDLVAAFYVKDASFSMQRDGSSISFLIAITEASVVDFSCKEGIRVLGVDTTPAPSVETPELETKSHRLVSVDCQLSAGNERLAGNLDVKLGRIQCLVLPCFVRALLKFRDEFASGATNGREIYASGRKEKSRLKNFRQVSFATDIQSFSLLLSSKDLLRHIRDSPERTVGVVAVRLGATLKGLFALSPDGELPADVRSNGSSKAELNKYLDGRRSAADLDSTLRSSTEFHAHGLQIVRTGIRRSTRSPFTFQQTTTAMTGEQRITNQFQFAVEHELVATWFRDKINPRNDPQLSISHGLQVRVGFVDLLVYIAQSTEGINEAIRVSVWPIVQMLKAQKEEASKTNIPSRNNRVELLASGPAVFSVRIEAVQVTLVPGGATRLNQSPIIKFALFRVAGGGAMTTSTAGISSAPNSSRHLVLGAWLGSEISASYHNTRLVAWEPVIEPWTLNAQIGVDLTRAFKLPTMAARRLTPSLNSSAISVFSPTSGRLAEWGRLFRSPFGAGTASATKDNEQRSAETDFDFCLLLLIFAASDLIRTASSLSLTHVLPGNRPGRWLRNFGYPTSTSLDGEILSTHPAVVCRLNDVAPLDVNVTGALIDDLWEHIRDGDSSRRAPHWIRNNTGLTLRFEEVLDVERMARGEKAAKVILPHGTEAPLSLKRSLSQSCDPHRAFIKMEIGSYSDTCGRLDLDVPKGTRSSAFSYRIAAKIPVDMVGVQRFPLDLNYESMSESKHNQAWVLVRVALRGGIKFVSVESPLAIKNVSDTDILCEARDHDGLSLIWRCVVPKLDLAIKGSSPVVWPVPIPADVASYVHGQSCLFSVMALSLRIAAMDESEFPSTNKDDGTKVNVPPPYSRSSLERGVIAEMDIRVPVLVGDTQSTEVRHLNALSFRVGSLALEQTMKSQRINKTSPEIPEQRLILFRSPLVIRNHLASPVEIQMRALSDTSVSTGGTSCDNTWMHLGKLCCGDCLSWSLASPADKVEMRVRFPSPEGGQSRQFPSWSTPTVIPSDRDAVAFGKRRSPSSPSTLQLAKMEVIDSSNVSLFLSACVSRGGHPSDNTTSTVKDVKEYAEALPGGSRVVNIFVPFLVVDGSGLNLEYKCGKDKVAGQADSAPGSAPMERRKTGTLGLGELLDDDDLLYLPSRVPFYITMIGDDRSTEIAVRRRVSRIHHSNESPWSSPIYLTRANAYQDSTVLPPRDSTERFALRSRILRAPSAFGGLLGTRLVHIVCRYLVINKLGRDIEVASGSHTKNSATVIKADGRPRPFHFYGSEYAFFRLKEFGWQWSGRFNVKKKRKGVTLRVRHNLKGHAMIVDIEFKARRNGTIVIVFRVASHAPYRLENNTLLPLHFHQSSIFQSMTQRHQEAAILPYHSADFAWDEPDYGQRSISLRVADFGELPRRMTGAYLGCFRLDYLVPGTDVPLATSPSELEAKVVADGPTRVLRISEVSEAGPLHMIESGGHQFHDVADNLSSLTTSLHLSFHGLGISIIDWSPRELVYVRLGDILIEQRNDGSKDSVSASIAKITVDNQLWVTPYPVALKMGFPRAEKPRNRKLNAISLSWVRALGTSTGYNDLLLFEKAELSTQPIAIRVDGQLAGLALNMLRQIKQGTTPRSQSQTLSRSAALGRALDMDHRVGDSEDAQQLSGEEQLSLFVDGLYDALDYMATSSIAAKLRSQYRHPDVARPVARKGQASRKSPSGHVIQHKVYLEKLKISGLAAELSWNGPVPVHWWIFPSVAFEGLPLSLRPFSISHSYGTVEEHLQSVASHYISIRRGIDLVVGVFWRKPFFIPREIMTYILSSASAGLQASERGLLTFSSAEAESTRSLSMQRIVVDPVVSLSATILHVFSNFAKISSSIVRHGTVRHRPASGQVRQRNPRLFAHVDGNDLLVDFQEGENAGKALLSRVRMGLHLGEGYVYHVEGALEPRKVGQGWRTRNVAPMTLIVMITLERILVVKGALDAHFCEVVWETPLSNIVHIEFFKAEQKTHDLVVLWYLTGTETLLDKDDRPARVLVADVFGLDTLRSRATLVPKTKTETFLKKIASLQSSLLADELIAYP